jgi:hypothetical protein
MHLHSPVALPGDGPSIGGLAFRTLHNLTKHLRSVGQEWEGVKFAGRAFIAGPGGLVEREPNIEWVKPQGASPKDGL